MVVRNSEDLLDAAKRNDLKAVKFCVETQEIPPDSVDSEKRTAAHIAAENGYINILEYLLQQDTSLLYAEDSCGDTVLSLAAENDHLAIVKYLVEEKDANIFRKNDLRVGNTPVHLVTQAGHLDVLKYFIEDKFANFNMKNKLGESLLFLAAENQQLHIVKYLVEKWSADTKAVNARQETILFASAKVGDLRIPKYLLEEMKVDLDINHQDVSNRTIIHWAAAYGYLGFTKYFIEERKASFDLVDSEGRSPLHHAAISGHVKIIVYLVGLRANPAIKDNHGHTPLDDSTDVQVTKYLQKLTNKYDRRRRSVPVADESAISKPQYWLSMFFEWAQKLGVGNQGSINRVDGHVPVQTATVGNFHVDSFLSLVNIFLHTRIPIYQPAMHRFLLSPQEIIQSRMDPVAIVVTNMTSEFGELNPDYIQ